MSAPASTQPAIADNPKGAARPVLSVIIVSYNTMAMTLTCLKVLYANLGDIPAEVILVDNASTDGTVDAIRLQFPDVIILASPANLGFGRANNLALEKATGDYYLLLNSDAFPRYGAIPKLIEHLKAHPKAGVAGPRLLNKDGTLQISCYRFPTPLYCWLENLGITKLVSLLGFTYDYRQWPHDRQRSVEFAIGACLLVRKDVYKQIGGFDERFFMYQEEADWELRIRRAGWQIHFCPRAEVVHFGGATGQSAPERVSGYFFESLDKFVLKHHGSVGAIATRAAMLLGSSARAFFWAVRSVTSLNSGYAAGKMRAHLMLAKRQALTPLAS